MIYRVLGPIFSQGFLVEPFSSGAECQKNTQTKLLRQNASQLEAKSQAGSGVSWTIFEFAGFWSPDMTDRKAKIRWAEPRGGMLCICQSHRLGYLSRHQTLKTIWEMIRTMPVSPVQSEFAGSSGLIGGAAGAASAAHCRLRWKNPALLCRPGWPVIWSVTVETVWEC